MSNFGTNNGEKFAQNVITAFFAKAVAPEITNSDYEGEITGGGADRLNVLSFGSLTLQDYTGAALTAETPQESEGQLIVDQKKAYYFKIDSVSKFVSYASNPESTLIKNAGDVLRKKVDQFVLGFYGDVAAGNRIGTDYVTGTVTVTTVTGAVVGVGTTFTAAMVGRGFKAVGHSVWYRVKTVTDGTNAVIEDDEDDIASHYSGGAIAGGTAYVIEAATKLQVTKSTIYSIILQLGEKLDVAEVPKEDRWITVNSKIATIVKQAPELIPAVNTAYENIVMKGLLGTIDGMLIFESERVSGDNTTGYHILAGHKSFITFAMAFTESEIEPLIGGFGKAYKGLNVYGAKVLDSRRVAGAEAFLYV